MSFGGGFGSSGFGQNNNQQQSSGFGSSGFGTGTTGGRFPTPSKLSLPSFFILYFLFLFLFPLCIFIFIFIFRFCFAFDLVAQRLRSASHAFDAIARDIHFLHQQNVATATDRFPAKSTCPSSLLL